MDGGRREWRRGEERREGEVEVERHGEETRGAIK